MEEIGSNRRYGRGATREVLTVTKKVSIPGWNMFLLFVLFTMIIIFKIKNLNVLRGIKIGFY